MPRPMPPLGTDFGIYVDRMLTVCASIEIVRESSQSNSPARRELTHVRLGHLYEAAYLRVFAKWETFLEETCLRHMIGYTSPMYAPMPMMTGIKTLSVARTQLYGTRDYLLWHNPRLAARRASTHLVNSPVETVLYSSIQSLEWMAAVRHRIAHDSDDARSKFDAATMGLAGQRYRGGRPGLFLRSPSSGSQRWLPTLATRLKTTALQIAP